MAVEVSDTIDSLRSYLAWIEENTEIKGWIQNTDDWDKMYEFSRLKMELRLVQRTCSCVEMFLLQDLPSESEEDGLDESLLLLQDLPWESEEDGLDESLDSFFNRLGVAINEKAWEIHSVCQEIYEGLELEGSTYNSLFSSFHDAMETLKPLFGKTVDKYQQTSQSKLCALEELLEFIQLVSEDVKEIHSTFGLKDVQQKFLFLKNFIGFAASRGVGHDQLQGLLAHTKFVVTTATYWSYMKWKPTTADRTTWSLIELQYSEMLKVQPEVRETYIKVLNASRSSCPSDNTWMDDNKVGAFIDSLLENHWELLASNSSFIISTVKILVEELRFLRNFLIYQRQKGGDLDEEIIDHIVDAVCEAGILIYSHSWDDLKEDSAKDAERGLSNWMEKVELLKRGVAKKYPETSRYKFPRTNDLGFMDGLLEDLKEFIKHNPDSIAFAQGKMDVVLEDLVFLRDFLQDMVKLRNEHEELKALWICIVDVAYKTEFVINSLVVGDPSPDCSLTSFNTVKEEIKKIKTKVKGIYMEKRYRIEALKTTKISKYLPSRSSSPAIDEVIVGFEEEAEEIIDRLKAESAPLDIISIVGMPGQGKTTLAKKVYNDSSIRSHFHVCAWCCVSQGYQKRKLLLDILSDTIDELPYGFSKMSDEDLEEVLYRSLKGRRYLIVLDDKWEIEAWHDLQLSFPNDHNRSRILFTSRIHNVALQAKPDSNPHILHLLNDAESMKLLQQKLFPDKDCTLQQWNVRMQIAKSCKGLPLAIVTVAGILANLEEDSWKDFAEGLSTALVSSTDQSTELLELSYIHLPDYLKPCLLYFGSFLEDQEIPVSRLIRLWMAEGFVQKTTDEKSKESVAEDYLIDLIKRSLVMVVQQTSRGGIKACRMHDLVHQFCMTKAKEENFLQQLNLHAKCGPLSEPRRLCIYSDRRNFCEARLCFRHLSSLVFFNTGEWSVDAHDVSSISCYFKLLKVLDLGDIICSSFPAEVVMLVHLRYLALVGQITSIPSTIDKLWNLETFLVTGLTGEISLPYTFLNMTKLRHLHVNDQVVFSSPEENLEKFPELCTLETFSTPFLLSGQDMVKILRKMPHILKLKCTYSGSRDSEEGYQFPAWSFLSRLESLKVHSTGKIQHQLEFNFPLNLKKLTLSNFYLPWALISRLAELPNLEVLKLLNRACEGETWDMGEEEFTKLQFLKLENLDIVNWNAYSDNFPCLQQLVLHRCRKLRGIPSYLGEIPSLAIIKVKYCHRSVATSAQTLEEEIEGLKADVHVPTIHLSASIPFDF